MDMIWKKPNGSIAATVLCVEVDDRVAYAATLKERGEIPQDWVLVSPSYSGPYPSGDFDKFVWDAVTQQVTMNP